jgi:hypothetical protein
VVHHDHRIKGFQAACGGSHPEAGGLEDIDAIDELDPNLADHPTGTTRAQPVGRFLTLERAQFLGIADAVVVGNLIEGGGTHDHRTSKRATADLVDTDYEISAPQESSVLLAEGFVPQLGTP